MNIVSDIFIFLTFFYFLLISVIGYGLLFQKIFFSQLKNFENYSIYIGFNGLFLLTLLSLFTSFFFVHDFKHNLLIHVLGIIFCYFIKNENKKKYLKIILLISIFTIISIFISKTHDDFSYYHLPFTKYLTEHKVIFGIGNLLHGYKLLSSLFFLNSTFYLPYIKHFSFHYSQLYFLIFFNYFLYKEIFSKEVHQIPKYLYIFALLFFNLSFNRIAEFGTDKAGQLLITLLVIKLFQISCFNKKNELKVLLPLIPLFAYCLTLKTYFLSYIFLAFTLYFFKGSIFKNLKIIFLSKSALIFLLSLFIYFFHHFISTGCIISPISFTCFGDNLNWAQDKEFYKRLSMWLEQWAKAGAGPNFRVEYPEIYVQNFNWVSRWLEYYFLGKVTDQLLILIITFVTIFFIFKKFDTKINIILINKKVLFFYVIIVLIFLIWFTHHPQLRYGGYSIVFLTFSIPIAFLFYFFKNKKKNAKNKFKILLILIVFFFNVKNIHRINDEILREDHYQYKNFPFYAILEKYYSYEITKSGLVVYKTTGHCWNIPSPCVQSLDKLKIDTIKKNGYYFFVRSNK